MCVGKGGGRTRIFSPYHFWGLKILNFNIFGGIKKNEYFLGYEDFVDIFWSHHKIGLVLGVNYVHFRVFLMVKVDP